VNPQKLYAGLAGIALIAGAAAGVAAPARAANASPSPSPSPSPPPQALSCTANNNPGVIYGTLPSSGASNVQVNTTVQVFPSSADGRAYLAYQEAQVKKQAATMSASPSPAPAASPNYLAVQNQSENFSALARRLSPFLETTSTDANGNWACGDLTLLQPYLLFAALTVNTTTTATPSPAVAMVSGNQPVTKTQTTQIYYASQAIVRTVNPGSPVILHLDLPFAKWTKIAQIVQPS
jgi:hypothetical protein